MSPGRLRVAMLIWSYWPGHEGGAERQCRKLIPHLASQDLHMEVWTAWTDWRHARVESREDHVIVRLGWLVPLFLAPRRWLEARLSRLAGGDDRAIRQRARRREALLFWFGLPFVWLARAGFLIELGWRVRRRHPDLIHVHESSWLAGAAAHLARRFRIPVLAKTALHPAMNALGYDVPLRRTCHQARNHCRFAAMAQYLADDLKQSGIAADRIYIVPNGVEIPDRPAEPERSRTVLCVANFSQGAEHKGFDVLLHAWRRVIDAEPRARLVMIGDGPRKPWEEMAHALDMAHAVVFTGWIPDPAEYYRSAAVFVLASRREGLSNSLLEAQSWGLPCVVTDIPGNTAVVRDQFNGLVVPCDNPDALASAIVRLLSDPLLMERLGKNGRELAGQQYDFRSVAASLRKVYGILTGEADSAGGAPKLPAGTEGRR